MMAMEFGVPQLAVGVPRSPSDVGGLVISCIIFMAESLVI